MKILKKIVGIILVLFVMSSTNLFSQLTASPYVIKNFKPCSVEVHYRVFDGTSGTCSVQCAANNVIIPAFASLVLSCVVAISSDIQIELIKVGGFPISPIANVNYGSGSGGGGNWSCFTMLTQFDSGSVNPAAVFPCLGGKWSITVGATLTSIN